MNKGKIFGNSSNSGNLDKIQGPLLPSLNNKATISGLKKITLGNQNLEERNKNLSNFHQNSNFR